jgi:hypothetical protein
VAREAGLDTIDADVLAGNAAMLALLRTLELPQRNETDGETVTVSIDLTAADPPAVRRDRARAHLARAVSWDPPG